MSALSPMEVWGRVADPSLGRAERFRVRVEPCSCGTVILAEDDQASWTEAVARHYRSLPHLRWERIEGCDGCRMFVP